MPIKHLDTYLSDKKLLQTHPLSVLSDSRLGIDAAYYLQTLYDHPPSREPLLAATGGQPLALALQIETDLRALERLRIKPVFVFPGLVPNKRLRHQQLNVEQVDACRDRREAWQKYEAGQEEAATKLFEARSGLSHWDLWRAVLRLFRTRNVEFIVAPYIAWAQLVYLQRHSKSYIHAIYGPTDALLCPGVDKIITSIDLLSPSPSFTYVSKKAILTDMGVTEEQFLDIGILVGCEHCQPFPPTLHEQALKATSDMVKYYRSGHAAVAAHHEHAGVKTTQYADLFARTRALIKHSLIFSAEGTVQPISLAAPSPPVQTSGNSSNGPGGSGSSQAVAHATTAADVPSDLHEIFTHRLPDEVFFYLSRGLLNPQPLVWLASGQIIEPPPLDNGETTEYRRFVKEVVTEGQTGPRATALALLSSVMHHFWANRRVAGVFWFESGQQQGQQGGPGNKYGQHGHVHQQLSTVQHNSQQTAQLAERVAGWHVPYVIVEEELRRQNWSTIDFALCLGATATDKQAARTKARTTQSQNGNSNSNANSQHPHHAAPPLEKKDEIVANAIWRFLELRGFLLKTHEHSPLARAMHTAIRRARVTDKFQDPLYLFLELVRAGVMHGHLWSGRAFSGGPSFGTDDEKACMLLVMRTLSIVPLNFQPVPWSAPLSRELLVFNSFVRSLTRALRTLLEVTTLNMLLRTDARRARDDLLDITMSLPFQGEVNTGFGVLAKVYLDALTHLHGGQRVRDADGPGVREAKAVALEICEETFPGVKAPKMEVERGFRFWDVALMAMRQLHAEGSVQAELIDQFEAAEAWLGPMRP